MEKHDIRFSDEAIMHAKRLQKENVDWSHLPLRIYMDGKGCSGFLYGISFDESTDEDILIEQDEFKIVIDPKTIKFVKGSVVNWVDDERGTGFLVDNPNHKNFRGKFFRREGWQERLLGEDGSAGT
ncbi:MAG: iron-sulfur cluster assembly accessory protein [Bdellovibrionota bacterium]